MRGIDHIGILPEPVRTFGIHLHHAWEIIYYIEGTGVVRVGSSDIPFRPGLIVCMPPGIPHSETSESGYRNYHMIVRFFDGLGSPVPVFSDNEHQDGLGLISRIYREYHIRQKNWMNIVESLLDALCQYMVSWSDETRMNPLVEGLRNTLVANLSNAGFALEEALDGMPASPDHIRKLFKKETGRTPLEYLTEMRIGYGKQLLALQATNQYKIREVAALCGFNDPYYFSRLFTKVVGSSPRAFVRLRLTGG